MGTNQAIKKKPLEIIIKNPRNKRNAINEIQVHKNKTGITGIEMRQISEVLTF